MQPENIGTFGGLFFFIIWAFMMIVILVGYIILFIAIWRAMRAHESIANTLKLLADSFKPKP